MKYELVVRSARRPSFIPQDLRYFNDHFVCRPMEAGWEIPPAKLQGVKYGPTDFILWMQRAPVISEKAKTALEPLCQELVEFLPFHAVKGKPYYAMNVLNIDQGRVIYKEGPRSVIFACDRFGAVIRDNCLSGLELADPADDNDRKVIRGESVNVFPGLLG